MGLLEIIIEKSNVAHNPQTIGQDSRLLCVTKVAVDILLLHCRIGGGIVGEQAIDRPVRVGIWIRFRHEFRLPQLCGKEFGIVLRNIAFNPGGVINQAVSKFSVHLPADWLCQFHQSLKDFHNIRYSQFAYLNRRARPLGEREMAKNETLSKAKNAKKDEFYTQYEDIQEELNHYEKHFRGQTVLCNCDDPFESNFCKFFLRNFNYLGLKRLICTSYGTSPVVGQQMSLFDDQDEPVVRGQGYVMDISSVPMANGRGVSDEDIEALLRSKRRGVKKLKGDGDFRSEECIAYLKQADIVVTNPPFSLFREYVAQLIEYGKKFLIIGSKNAITYKEIFPLIQQNKVWLGYGFRKDDAYFRIPPEGAAGYASGVYNPNTGLVHFRNCTWYTNLDHAKRHEELILYRRYYGHEENYPRYANYDAINVDKVTDIPCDYFEEVGVPITYLDKHNPEQFEIIGASR